MTPYRPLRSLWIAAAVLASTLIAALVAGHTVQRSSMQEENQLAMRQLQLYAQALSQRIDRFRTLPDVLALDPDLRAALTQTNTSADVLRLNQKLEQANGATLASTLTLINRSGLAIAASNWQTPHSNVGEDYSFRPYVQQALAHSKGSFYGIGVTTGEAGYFLSRAIVDDSNTIVGLIVIKIALQELEREWVQTPDTVFATDAHGISFLASNPAWRYRLLKPLDSNDQHELARTQQYGSQALALLVWQTEQILPDGGRLVQWQDPSIGRRLWQSIGLPEAGWQLHILHDVDTSTAAGWWAASGAGGAWLALSLLVLYARQRQRIATWRQRSREELEAVLKQHAQELRSAQDGVVQAAKKADAGLSQGLEHLPQGVVVMDASLHLMAWNSRYLELFKLPSGLLHTGMPVEDLYRYNAGRGMLGVGSIDDAIERRMQYLRNATPHVRESERADGTVLEIRGNPLPGGGFVTSYADITSYKNAARDLRSLADTLEKRVEDRTHALGAAKREAEQANRHKSKFVAAAVHDLLQPLNAARVFASLLRQHVHSAEGLQLASNVEGALNAQDDILNSLLDIARMESGQLKVQPRDFALQPLLASLGNHLGVLAQRHGLQLRVQSTRYTVHSDDALLRRVLQNFLSNAIRYTRQGRIVLGCRRHGQHLHIEVHDQGPGIPESLQQEIFEEFRRLETGHQHERGAGLGLAIVDRLGKLLGHEIGLRATLGRGSVFWIAVPLTSDDTISAINAPVTVSTPPAPPKNPGSPADTVVWCISPQPAALSSICPLLSRWGYQVQSLANLTSTPTSVPQLLVINAASWQPDDIAQHINALPAAPAVIWFTEQIDAHSAQAARWGWSVLQPPIRPAALRALVSQLLLRQTTASENN